MPKSLNELDKKTLHSYRDKARLVSKVNKRNAQTMDNVAKQKAQAGDMKGMSQALDSAKKKREVAYKRDAGSDRALKKLKIKAKDDHNYKMDMARRGPQKAPSDNEMKKMAKHYNAEGMYSTFSMKKVDKHDIPKRGLSPAEKRNKEDIVKGMKKNKTDFMKRYGRDHEAVMHATATKLAKQDEETIHELDDKTLKSYEDKASADAKKKVKARDFDGAQKRHDGISRSLNTRLGRSVDRLKKSSSELSKATKSFIDRANQREETINELDKETLKSYVGKAQAERLNNIDKFEKESKRGESIIAKSALKKVQKRGMGVRQAQKKLGEAEFDADKPKRGIQRKRVNLQFGRQQRHNPTPFKKDQQQDLYKKSDSVEKKIRKSRENKRFPDYRQDKDTGAIKKDFLPGGEHAKKYGGLQNKKTKPNVTATTEDRVINQLKILIAENKYDLYSSGEHKTASRFAEKEIDRHLAKAKKMKDYHTARTHMDKVLSKHSKHGSDDSEPHRIVTGHLNNHFGTKHGHNDHLDFMKGRPEYSGPRVKPVKENFQDGRNPEDKGDAKRHGLSGKQSSSSLKKVRSSDSASPRKKQLAHWILNMRKGRNKKK